MSKSEIIAIHPCDSQHQVVRVKRSNKNASGKRTYQYRREPCDECPWRKDSPIGAFPVDAYRHSAATCYDMAGTTFACHMRGAERPTTCAGFLLSGSAIHNLQVRLALADGVLDLDAVKSTVGLYASYREMAISNGVAPDDPALAPCRDE